MIGEKRQRELMEEELFSSPQDQDIHNGCGLSESEESKHGHPQKRQKLAKTEQWSLSTTTKQDTLTGPIVYVAHTDA